MANVNLTISCEDPKDWASICERLVFYAEEADVRVDTAEKIIDLRGREVGVMLKVPAANAIRLQDIILKAGLTSLTLTISPISSHTDPDELKVREKLYTGGDTSKKAAEPKERELPSSRDEYFMTREEYSAWLKGQGRRTRGE